MAVDGRSTAELSTDEAAAMLSGEEGSSCRVVAETAGQRRELLIRREHVEVPSLEDVRIVDAAFSSEKGLNLTAEQLAAGVAYVRIPAFQKTTSRDLDAALWDLHGKGMRSLVLDLRGNPGGLLTAAVEVADKFLQEGGIVSTRGRSPQEDFNYQAHYGGTWRVPLVVLIDGDSASASEIFAAAIKDNSRGEIVGVKSYGKGSVQGIFPLGYGGAGVRLTTALFYSPNGQKISKNGVTPRIEVPTTRTAARPVTGASSITIVANDATLEAGVQAAIDAAKQRVGRPVGVFSTANQPFSPRSLTGGYLRKWFGPPILAVDRPHPPGDTDSLLSRRLRRPWRPFGASPLSLPSLPRFGHALRRR